MQDGSSALSVTPRKCLSDFFEWDFPDTMEQGEAIIEIGKWWAENGEKTIAFLGAIQFIYDEDRLVGRCYIEGRLSDA